MIPPIDAWLTASAPLVAIVQDRIWRAVVPENEARPYVVWSIVSGIPENTLSCIPDSDDQRSQVDCYSKSQGQAKAMALAARNAIELHADIVFGPIEFYEPDTKLYRWSMDVQTLESR